MLLTWFPRSTPRGVLLASVVLLAGACTSLATPATTFGPGVSSGSTPDATAPTKPEPTSAQTPGPTPAATTFLAGTAAAPRRIAVTMTDAFRFDPSDVTVQAGETVTFVLTNAGVIEHDFTIGDADAQERHALEMISGEMHHGVDPNALMVDAGSSGELTFTFGDPAEWLIGCHVAGHYDAGMQGKLHIVASLS